MNPETTASGDPARVPLVSLGQGDYRRDYHPEDLGMSPAPQATADPTEPAHRRRGLLTATRLATLRRCPRQHYYRFELGLSRIRSSDALRLGAAFHRGLELHNVGMPAAEALSQAAASYDAVPEWADTFEWQVERETVQQLLTGHFWRYGSDDVQVLAVEQGFELPLVNPHTGRPSRAFALAGKIDAIVRLADGRLAVLEYKTSGEDIGPDSDYWLRLRCDPQLSQYVLAARALGYEVTTVLYDVTRKPTIRPRNKPQPETPAQYGARLLQDIGDRPDYYFQRREVPRLEDELAEFQLELWQQAKQLLDSRRHGRWFRNVQRFTCGTCEFANLCLNSVRVTAGTAPAGYSILSDVHPELSQGVDA